MKNKETVEGIRRHAATHAACISFLLCLLAATASAQTHAASSNGVDKIPPPPHSVEKILIEGQPPLTPGSKAVKIVVSVGVPEVVARSSVSWGYHDGEGKFKLGGTQDFDYRGGTLFGEIPADYSPKTIEIKAAIDYTNPEVGDVAYRRDEPVTDAGVMVLFNTTAIKCETVITLLADKKLKLRKDNDLLLTWRYESADPSQPQVKHGGSISFSYSDLKAVRGGLIQKQFDLPVRSQDDGRLFWSLEGRVGKGAVNVRGSFTPATPRLEINIDRHGKVTDSVTTIP